MNTTPLPKADVAEIGKLALHLEMERKRLVKKAVSELNAKAVLGKNSHYEQYWWGDGMSWLKPIHWYEVGLKRGTILPAQDFAVKVSRDEQKAMWKMRYRLSQEALSDRAYDTMPERA